MIMTGTKVKHNPQQASIFAADHLSPSFPHRAAWGTATSLRQWQSEALEKYLQESPRDFLAVATPGAGKTTFALRIAVELMGTGIVDKLTVVCPTQHLKFQWAEAAARVGIQIDPAYNNAQGQAGKSFDGVALTYAQVAANPYLHRKRTQSWRTLVIFDEIHHAGDALSWGDGVLTAFESATRRLCLTGTPFRSDSSPIPFVRYYEDDKGIFHSQADYAYSYGPALKDGVVRPVLFLSYSGEMYWQDKTGNETVARLGSLSSKDMEKQAWRTALDPEGAWISQVLHAANQRLLRVRRQIPDAGGLVIASNQTTARSYSRILEHITGETPTLVLSDEEGASEKIEDFAKSDKSWMVAVRMVSEGVDVPRLCVGVYATSACTPLYFAQAVGRFVRSRKRGEIASIFLPNVRPLLELARQMEKERDHALDKTVNPMPEALELALSNRVENASNTLEGFKPIQSEAEFSGVLFDGAEFGLDCAVGSPAEQDFLGIPGLLDPEQVATILHQRQAKQLAQQRRELEALRKREKNSQIAEHRRRANLRKELSSLVAQWARRSGEPHANIHASLRRRCGGPAVPQASVAELEKRVELIRKWFVGMK